jgi:MinD-like ATPase involved in chromosome partitioning or flagellar assembly
VSEHDWQAAVLAELGIPPSGLVTPDSGRPAAPPAVGPAASATGGQDTPSRQVTQEPPPMAEQRDLWAEEQRPEQAPASPDSWDEPSMSPDSWDEPPAQPPVVAAGGGQAAPYDQWGDRHAGSSRDGHAVPGPVAWSADPVPPSAQVHSAPEPPGLWAVGQDEQVQPASSQAPRTPWPQPPQEAPSPQTAQEPPADRALQEPPADRASQEGAWDQASQASWDEASQGSWDRLAQSPRDGEVPPQAPDTAAPEWREACEQSEGGAWQRDAEQPPDRSAPTPPAPGGQPPAPQDLVRRTAYGDPLVRRMTRGVRRAVGATAANEVRMTADVESVLGRPVASCRQIAVTSIRGGAGKTTVAGLTATVIAQYRQDRVLAVDADSELGSLPLRLGVGPERSLHDLASTHPRTFDEAARYLARTTDGLWVLSGTAGGRISRELDLATFQAAAGGMTRYFAAAVIDCGAGLLPELQRGILADAHSQVMVTPGTVDGALSARGALEWQARSGYQHLLTRTVIAFVTHTPHVDADLTRAAQMLSVGGMPVVHLPYDRHLAAGTAVESARIGQETRAAAIRVAMEAFARATSV